MKFSGSKRVIRGGSWYDTAFAARVSVRSSWVTSDFRDDDLGFRMIRGVR